MVSREKVEKVVKPPQIPIVRKASKFGFIGTIFIENSVMIPMIKDPTKLMISVEMGKADEAVKKARPTRYLQIEPINPPNPIKIHFIINLSILYMK
jgi:hypothetical protein